MRPKEKGYLFSGIIDPVSIIGGLFLVAMLVVGTFVAKNKNFSFNINEKASCMTTCMNQVGDQAECNFTCKESTKVTDKVTAPAPKPKAETTKLCGYCKDTGTCVSCTNGGENVGECSTNNDCNKGSVNLPPDTSPAAPDVKNNDGQQPQQPQVTTGSLTECTGTDQNYAIGAVVVGGVNGASNGYAKCTPSGWVADCDDSPNSIRLCSITDIDPTLAAVPSYLQAQYQEAISALQQDTNTNDQNVADPEIQNPSSDTAYQTTALTEQQQRDKSFCLQEGGNWTNNKCSYQQQNDSINTFKPVLELLQIEITTCSRGGGTWINGKCVEKNIQQPSGQTNVFAHMSGGSGGVATTTYNPCPVGSTLINNTCVTNQQNITNAENQIATLNQTSSAPVVTTSVQDFISSLTDRFNNVNQNTGMTDIGTYGLGGGNAYVAPIPQSVVTSKNVNDFYNYAIGNVVSNIAGFTTATLSTPGAPLFLFESATSIPGVVPVLTGLDVADNIVTGASCASGNQEACSIFQAQLFIPGPTGTASMFADSIDDFAKAMKTPLQSIDNLTFLDSVMRLDGTDMGGLPTITNSAIPDSTSSMLFAPNYQNSWSGLIPENTGGTNITRLANDISQINLHNPTTNLGDIGVTASDVYPAGWADDGISGLGFPNGYQFPKPSTIGQSLADLVDTIGINPSFGNIYPDGMVGRSLDSASSMIDGTLDNLANNVPLDVTFTLDDIAEVRPSVQNELIDNLTTPEVVASTSIPESIRQWWGNTVGDLNLAGLSPEVVSPQPEITQVTWFQRYIVEPIQNQFDDIISKFDNIAQPQLVELDTPNVAKLTPDNDISAASLLDEANNIGQTNPNFTKTNVVISQDLPPSKSITTIVQDEINTGLPNALKATKYINPAYPIVGLFSVGILNYISDNINVPVSSIGKKVVADSTFNSNQNSAQINQNLQTNGTKSDNNNISSKNVDAKNENQIPDFLYFSQKDKEWQDLQTRKGATIRVSGCGIITGGMVTGLNPEGYYQAYLEYFKNQGKDRTLDTGGTAWEDHRAVLESLGYTIIPIAGETQDIKLQIEEYTNQGIPVWINADLYGIGHHVMATGVNEVNNEIIINDPWRGEGFNIQDQYIDKSYEDGDDGWRVYAIIPPTDQQNVNININN